MFKVRRKFRRERVPAAALPVALSLLTLALPSGAHADSIRDALQHAFSANPLLNAQRASLAASSENLARAQSGYMPRVNAIADIGAERDAWRFSDDSRSTLKTAPRGTGVELQQNLFNGFQTTNSVKRAIADIGGASATLRSVEQNTLLSAATAYMDLVTDRAVLRFVRANVEGLRRQLQQTRERHQLADVTRADVAQVETRLAGAEADTALAEANVNSSLANYVRIIGLQPNQMAFPAAIDASLPRTSNEIVVLAERDNPAVQAASQGVKVALTQVDITRGELLPSLSVRLQLSKRYDYLESNDRYTSRSIVGTLSVPLYDGGEVRARIRQDKYISDQRALELNAIRDETRALALATWAKLVAARQRVDRAGAQVDAAERAYNGIREQWRMGDRTLREVLDSQQDVLSSRIAQSVALRDVIVASYALTAVTGRLSIARLDGMTLSTSEPRAARMFAANKSATDVARKTAMRTSLPALNDASVKQAAAALPIRASGGDDQSALKSSRSASQAAERAPDLKRTAGLYASGPTGCVAFAAEMDACRNPSIQQVSQIAASASALDEPLALRR